MTDSSETLAIPTRVLVLDDDVLMCQLLDRMLRRRGFTVMTETSPEAALAWLEVEPCELVISDVNLNGLDGLAFTQQVIALDLDLPVILITGEGTMEIAVNAVMAGAWDFLRKPIDATLLAVSIDRASKHRQLTKEVRELRRRVNGDAFPPAGAARGHGSASGGDDRLESVHGV